MKPCVLCVSLPLSLSLAALVAPALAAAPTETPGPAQAPAACPAAAPRQAQFPPHGPLPLRRLGELPPAGLMLAVLKSVGGCPVAVMKAGQRLYDQPLPATPRRLTPLAPSRPVG